MKTKATRARSGKKTSATAAASVTRRRKPRPSQPPPAARPASGPRVRLRLYRQGLGDCFLITFYPPTGPYHVLIDCGVLKGTPDARGKIKAVVQNILEATKRDDAASRVDLLIATHQHWDHLCGFLEARELFDGLQVDQVWLAWTEEPGNALADSLRKTRALRLAALANAQEKLGASDLQRNIESLLGFMGAGSGWSTQDALNYIVQKAPVAYQRPADTPIALLPGVRVFVLGPPEDARWIRKSDPTPSASEVYEFQLSPDAAFMASTMTGSLMPADGAWNSDVFQRSMPFDPSYCRSLTKAAKTSTAKTYLDPAQAWRKIDTDWLGAAETVALDLDSDTNNTSLALAFELTDTGQVLLFPGDAQVGNWLSWSERKWRVTDPGGKTRVVRIDDLLRRTVFYKAGHHGSHNATLRSKGLELMTDPDLVAMIPVEVAVAKRQGAYGWNMPFPSLYQHLVEHTKGRVLQSDDPAPAPSARARPEKLTAAEWREFCQRTAGSTPVFFELKF